MSLRVERNGTRASLGLDIAEHGIFVPTLFFDHRQCTLSIRSERVLETGIKGSPVGPCACIQGCDNLSGARVYNLHLLITAYGEEAVQLRIDGQSGGLFAAFQLPAVLRFPGLSIDRGNLPG